GQSGKPPVAQPHLVRCSAKLRMVALMIVFSNEAPDGGIQFSQREDGVWLALAVGEIPWQFSEQFGVDGAEDSLDFASTLWSCHCRVDDFKMQIPGGLGQMVTGEIRAVIHIKHIWDPTHRPVRMAFWPDSLTQR